MATYKFAALDSKGKEVQGEVDGGILDVLGQGHVRVIGEAQGDVEGSGAHVLGEHRGLVGPLGEREEGDLGLLEVRQ